MQHVDKQKSKCAGGQDVQGGRPEGTTSRHRFLENRPSHAKLKEGMQSRYKQAGQEIQLLQSQQLHRARQIIIKEMRVEEGISAYKRETGPQIGLE